MCAPLPIPDFFSDIPLPKNKKLVMGHHQNGTLVHILLGGVKGQYLVILHD